MHSLCRPLATDLLETNGLTTHIPACSNFRKIDRLCVTIEVLYPPGINTSYNQPSTDTLQRPTRFNDRSSALTTGSKG